MGQLQKGKTCPIKSSTSPPPWYGYFGPDLLWISGSRYKNSSKVFSHRIFVKQNLCVWIYANGGNITIQHHSYWMLPTRNKEKCTLKCRKKDKTKWISRVTLIYINKFLVNIMNLFARVRLIFFLCDISFISSPRRGRYYESRVASMGD